jgi:nitrous oxidase accessory protein
MSKHVTPLLILTLLAACLLNAPLPSHAANKTITVPDDYPTIEEAITNALDGDIILVKSGTYQEQQLTINKTLTLIGENPDSTKIVLNPPEGPYGPLGTFGIDYPIKVQANNVTLSGLTIVASGDRPPMLSIGGDVYITGNGARIFDNIFETGVAAIGNQTYVTNNAIYDMSFTNLGSLSLFGSHQVVTNNTVWGIWVENSEYDIISWNTILGTPGNGVSIIEGAGILLRSATMNQIYDNNIVTSGHCVVIDWYIGTSGLQTRESDNNTFYHNNFVTNSTPVDQVGYGEGGYSVNNIWDSGTEGNYWSDYHGSDANGDGKGDTSYIIDASNQDKYPLVNAVDIPGVSPLPFQSPAPSPSTTPNPSPTLTPLPTATPTLTPTATSEPKPQPFPTIPVFVFAVVACFVVAGASFLLIRKRGRGKTQ